LPFAGINGLAYNPRDQHFYATTVHEQSGQPTSSPPIFRISLGDFSATSFPINGITLRARESLDGLEFDSLRNVFWATNPTSNQLIQINPMTFEAVVVGEFSRRSHISGLAYDRGSDRLYGIDDVLGFPNGIGGSQLVIINTDSLALTTVGLPGLGWGVHDIDSLAYDPTARQLYAYSDVSSSAFTQQLLLIDPTTGIAKLIGRSSLQHEIYQGLAYVVPEPSSFRAFPYAILTAVFITSRRRLNPSVWLPR
jgi:hypothetical protein